MLLLLAQETAPPLIVVEPLFEETGFVLAIMGMLVVFAALVLVSLLVKLLPVADLVLARYFPDEPVAAAVPSDGPADGELPEEILVVIAAAVAEAVGEPHRIVRTAEITADELAWSLGGRLQHHGSHRPRPRNR